jgi:uncharacterized protein (TIGR03067 family)
MRQPTCAALACLIGFVAGGALRGDDPAPPRGDLAKLQGTWEARLGPKAEARWVLTIDGRRVVSRFLRDGREVARVRGTVKVDDAADPRRLDVVGIVDPAGQKGDDLLAIYRLDGDSLTLCHGTPGAGRPARFEERGGGPNLPTLNAFKRVRRAEGEILREINKPFQDPDINKYIKGFEDESREVFAKRNEIVRALGLRPGMAVADVGAGTGAFTRLVAEEVGPKGKVYAVDIAAAFLEHIAAESKKRGHDQVATIRGTQDTTNLPEGSIDVAFLVDTYHHLEHPRAVLGSIQRALRPGGRLVVVEFDRREGVSTPFVLEHVRADKETFLKEIESAGFERVDAKGAPEFKENFLAKFRKPDPPAEVRKEIGLPAR